MRIAFNATSNADGGTGGEATSRRLRLQCVGMGAADKLVVAGRIPGSAAAYQPIALKKKGTDAVVAGATGIVNDADVFEVDAAGLEVQFQYTKAVNNIVLWVSEVVT